jgi:hypothetical protein
MTMTGYYSEENHGPSSSVLQLGDFELENGITLPGASNDDADDQDGQWRPLELGRLQIQAGEHWKH